MEKAATAATLDVGCALDRRRPPSCSMGGASPLESVFGAWIEEEVHWWSGGARRRRWPPVVQKSLLAPECGMLVVRQTGGVLKFFRHHVVVVETVSNVLNKLHIRGLHYSSWHTIPIATQPLSAMAYSRSSIVM